MKKLIEVKDLKKWFYVGKNGAGKRKALRAVDGVSFFIKPHKTPDSCLVM